MPLRSMMATLAAWRRGRASLRRRGRWHNRARSRRSGLYVATSPLAVHRIAGVCCSAAMGGNRRVAVGEAASSWSVALCGAANGVTSSCCAFDPGEGGGSRVVAGKGDAPSFDPMSQKPWLDKRQAKGLLRAPRPAHPDMSVASALGVDEGQNGRCVRNEPLSRWILTWVGPQVARACAWLRPGESNDVPPASLCLTDGHCYGAEESRCVCGARPIELASL
ncbi:hypothetical protein QBC34DRAFT_413021 [Podospora aff. communis PSN243]|uniref:Uncharacterized protein n=1 Tax=Podospora aff. communis PSN243 TaxID=3040156 RepID=A0AAV9G9P2_9PEZI|nr:hypothetical protein QBC34DRAFT_413021 [Podospora aff. communis PSN243]